MTKLITWRKATEEEIEKGLDDSSNKGMIKVSEEEIKEEEQSASPFSVEK
jgi:hypothetical protein